MVREMEIVFVVKFHCNTPLYADFDLVGTDCRESFLTFPVCYGFQDNLVLMATAWLLLGWVTTDLTLTIFDRLRVTKDFFAVPSSGCAGTYLPYSRKFYIIATISRRENVRGRVDSDKDVRELSNSKINMYQRQLQELWMSTNEAVRALIYPPAGNFTSSPPSVEGKMCGGGLTNVTVDDSTFPSYDQNISKATLRIQEILHHPSFSRREDLWGRVDSDKDVRELSNSKVECDCRRSANCGFDKWGCADTYLPSSRKFYIIASISRREDVWGRVDSDKDVRELSKSKVEYDCRRFNVSVSRSNVPKAAPRIADLTNEAVRTLIYPPAGNFTSSPPSVEGKMCGGGLTVKKMFGSCQTPR
ncbi:hypothetical protein J6590_008921 [Homalodisca vitripennis]|nr:hypothetical protein J6590_008921 [Homalodisca vitripennis]